MQQTISRNMTEIYLIRHGETTLSHTTQYIGATDVTLSARGRRQAGLLAEHLKAVHFDVCYCSIMRRCQETAQILATPHHLEVIPLADLREIDYGSWETLTRAEMQTLHPDIYQAWLDNPGTTRAPCGESGHDVFRRVRPVLERLAVQHQGQRVLLVAHKTVNRIWLCHLLGYDLASYRQAIRQEFTAVNIVEYFGSSNGSIPIEGKFAVKRMNDISHLQAYREDAAA